MDLDEEGVRDRKEREGEGKRNGWMDGKGKEGGRIKGGGIKLLGVMS